MAIVPHLQAPLAVELALSGSGSSGSADAQTEGRQQQAAAAAIQQPQRQPADAPLALRLRNKQHFASTADLALSWRLLVDGLPAPAAGGAAPGGGAEHGWRPLLLAAPLGPQQEEARLELGSSWGEVVRQARGAAEPLMEVRAQVRLD